MQNLLHIKAISNKQINIINLAITTNTLSIIIIITLRFPWFFNSSPLSFLPLLPLLLQTPTHGFDRLK
jgi:hypothetical protein